MRRRVETFLIIGLGGLLGANLRYLVSVWAVGHFGAALPLGHADHQPDRVVPAGGLSGVGGEPHNARSAHPAAGGDRFFGAYTTFSTYANESMALFQAGDWVGALGNVLGTNALCLVGALVGLAIGSRL